MVGELLDGVGLVTIGDQEGVAGLDHDEVIDAEEGDFDSFLFVEDDVVFGVDKCEVTVGGIVVALVGQVFGDRDPGADIIPVEGGLDIEDMPRFFHERIVDGDGGEFRKLVGHRGGEIAGLGQFFYEVAELGSVLLKLAEDRGHRPDKHAGVPNEVASGQEFFSEFGVGLFAKAGNFEGWVFDLAIGEGRLFTAFDIAVAGAGPGGFDAHGHEGVRLGGDFHRIAHHLLVGSRIADELVSRENHHGGLRIASGDEADTEGHCRSGVAFGGLGEDILRRQHGGDFARLLLLDRIGEDEDVFVGNEPFESRDGLFEQSAIAEEIEQLLGLAIARERPEAGAGAAGQDKGIVGHRANITERLSILKGNIEEWTAFALKQFRRYFGILRVPILQ